MTVAEYTAIAVPVHDDRGGAADTENLSSVAQPCLEVEAPATLPEVSDLFRRCDRMLTLYGPACSHVFSFFFFFFFLLFFCCAGLLV